jgi:hypothetical protein
VRSLYEISIGCNLQCQLLSGLARPLGARFCYQLLGWRLLSRVGRVAHCFQLCSASSVQAKLLFLPDSFQTASRQPQPQTDQEDQEGLL